MKMPHFFGQYLIRPVMIDLGEIFIEADSIFRHLRNNASITIRLLQYF